MKNALHIFLLASIICTLSSCASNKIATSTNNAIISIPDSLYPPADLKINGHTPYTQNHYPKRVAYFKANPLHLHDVVFLGNSITEGGADWSKHLGKPGIQNRGIGGDISSGLIPRLGEIIYIKPRAVFILIGINDLLFTDVPTSVIAENIIRTADVLYKKTPRTKVFIQTILPTNRPNLIAKIAEVNSYLKNNRNANYRLIDIHQLFADENDAIKKEFTTDGIHLNEKGYTIWTEKLKEYFK